MLSKKFKKTTTTSLKYAQLSAFIVSFILPSFILISLLFAYFINQSIKTHKQEYENTLSVLSAHLNNNIDSDAEMSLSYLFDKNVDYFYKFLYRNEYTSDLISFNQYLMPYSKSISSYMTLFNGNIRGVGYIPCNKNITTCFYIKKYSDMIIDDNHDYLDSAWYQQLSANKRSIIFTKNENYEYYPNDNIISMIRAIKNIDKKQILGYNIIDISMDFIYNLLEDLSISEHSGIILSSPTQEFLFSTNEKLSGSYSLLEPFCSKIVYENQTYDVYTLTDDSYGFTFYCLSSRADLYKSYSVALMAVFLFYIVIILLAVWIFSRISRNISRSVNPILDTMAKYNAGDSLIQCNTSLCTISEIACVSENLNIMIQKINTYIDNEYKSQISQKTSEFEALQAEVNPHFLYNTLNIFITLNRIGDKSALEKAVISLSHLFRYTCQHTHDSSVAKEFQFIQNYLYLQQIRFDDRLTFCIYIEPGLEDFKIPKLLVQPLVENAIVHGLEPSDQTTDIQLSIFTAESKNRQKFIIISVSNTGLPYEKTSSPQKRVGLKNVVERLSYFCPNALFMISGGEHKPTKCCILIPENKI